MAPKSATSKPSEPVSDRSFQVLQDAGTQVPQDRQTRRRTAKNKLNSGHRRNEHLSSGHSRGDGASVKSDAEGSVDTKPFKRTPLSVLAQEYATRPRTLSAALAIIRRLWKELDAAEQENKDLKGEVVAYMDALYQANVDAGYHSYGEEGLL